ncbi:hypothetical protein O0L34_g6926 [Tuta absoluta]|nr:hypothetical protein O0L34_g6926 [Tuta absoluta]
MANSNKKKCLRLGLLNARSLNTGKDELTVTVLKYKPDLLALNETWLNLGEETLAPELPGYKLVLRLRQGRGGGVGFYVRKEISSSCPHSKILQLWLEVQLPGASLALGTAYRPESVRVQDALDALSESISSMARCDHLCFLGDMNIDLMKVRTTKVKELESFCQSHGLEQLVKELTRVTDTTESIIDIVMTDTPSKVQNLQVIHNRCLSDHAGVS